MDVRSHWEITSTEVKSCQKPLTVSAATETAAAAKYWTSQQPSLGEQEGGRKG